MSTVDLVDDDDIPDEKKDEDSVVDASEGNNHPPLHTTFVTKLHRPLPELPPLPFLSEPRLVRSNTDLPCLLSALSTLQDGTEPEILEDLGDDEVDAVESPKSTGVDEAEPEVPTATALELMEAAKPEEATLDFGEAMMALDNYVKGQTSDEQARSLFAAQLHTAFRVGCWTVILSLPIIVWPWAKSLQELSTSQREYLGYWGSMLLQFIFCIGPTFGASAKYSLEGWLGTALATINMIVLNNAFGPYLSGGAFQNRIEFFDNATGTVVATSKWLPLCNTGVDLSYNDCYLNMNTALAEEADYSKAIVVLMDFVLFVFAMLTFGFNTNVRVFSISTHVFYVMSFLDPSTGSFDIQPSLATNYFLIVSGASVGVLFCFLLPSPITSTSKAVSLLHTTGAAVAMVLESLPLTPAELCRLKAQAAMDEVAVLMKEADLHLSVLWFEDFGLWPRRAKYRRWLQAYFEVLKASIQNFDAVLCAAAALPVKDSEQVAAMLPSLRQECFLLASTLRALLAVKTPDEVKPVVDVLLEKMQTLRSQLEQEFPKGQQADHLLLPPALVFCLAVAGVVQDVSQALSSLALYGVEEKASICARFCRYLQSLQTHAEIKLYERTITHPRFVLRYTLTLTITFLIGWLGVSNVIAPYSSQPASTVSVIIYTFTAASLPLTLRRFNGVLLGKILGSVAQRLFAVQTVVHATFFALFQLVAVTVLVFLAFHSKKHGGVALLTAAYAMSALLPSDGIFREQAVKVTSSDGSFLFVTMVGTFIGVAVLLLVDMILASSAKRQAKQRLLRGLKRVSRFAVQVLDPEEDPDTGTADVEKGVSDREDILAKLQRQIYEDLDELTGLLPYAADETGLDGRPFPVDLCNDLEKGLRTLTRHFRIIAWAIQLLEKPQKQVILKAGSRIYKAAITPSSKVAPLLRDELFRPILATLAEEMLRMLENIRVLATASMQSTWRSKKDMQDDKEAQKVRELLRSKLYTKTVGNAFCSIARSPWKMAWKGARRQQEKSISPLAPGFEAGPEQLVNLAEPLNLDMQALDEGMRLRRSSSNPVLEMTRSKSETMVKATSSQVAKSALVSASKYGQYGAKITANRLLKQKRAIEKLSMQLYNEKLEEEMPVKMPHVALPPVTALEPGSAKQGVADNFALRLLLLFDKLRELASARRGAVPDDDPFSTLELIIFFLSSVQTQIQHMQVSLLEFS
ncbi:unnamed protein product [Durusdinium trenchii]|uniref:Uncharacterized protein n=2 Tax=Durusdinium trenchii TaxID=1381693 RepID=A0ABP0NFX6_9DINO